MNLAGAIQTATATLAAAGVENPRVDAEWLMAHLLDCRRPELALRREEELSEPQAGQWVTLIARRAERIPLQHLLGTAEFCGLEIAVNLSVLIPRPETERLAEVAWQFANTRERPTILDFGTGSGCLAIALAAHCPAAKIHALDVSSAALKTARENATKNNVSAQITFHQGDGFSALPARLRFDLIVSNPPYIPSGEIETLQPEVRKHEPSVALDGGADGLTHHRTLADRAGEWVLPGGRLMLEVGDGQAPAVASLLAGWSEVEILRDLNNIKRIVIASPADP